MLLKFLYFNANPNSVSLAPVPTAYENSLLPTKLFPTYVVESFKLTPFASKTSNNGAWFTSVFN